MTSELGAVHLLLPGPSSTPVGGYKVAYEYANELVDLGYRVTVWHSSAFLPMWRGAAYVKAAAKRWLWDLWTRARTGPLTVPWFEFDERVEVRNCLTKPRPPLAPGDVVVATAVQTMIWAAQRARRSGAGCVALIQHFEQWAASPDDIARAWAAPDARVVIAPWLAERCADFGLDSVLIPNAIDSSRFPAGPALSQRQPGVLSLLAPHAYKRPDVVMAALVEAQRLHPELRLTAFGQSRRPDDLPSQIDYVQDPSHDRLVQLYQSHPIYLCGSDAEGWHLPPAEATLCGAAVVSTDIGGVRVSMEDDAWYAPAGDWQQLARRVADILDDPQEASARAQHARARLLARTYRTNAIELAQVLFGTVEPGDSLE